MSCERGALRRCRTSRRSVKACSRRRAVNDSLWGGKHFRVCTISSQWTALANVEVVNYALHDAQLAAIWMIA
jgi:hypothetical protein